MPRFAAFCANPFDKRNVRLSSGHSTVCTFYGKSRQNKAKCYTQTDTNRIRIFDKSIRLNYETIVKSEHNLITMTPEGSHLTIVYYWKSFHCVSWAISVTNLPLYVKNDGPAIFL